MVACAFRAEAPGDIRYTLYHRALEALGHLVGTALEIVDAAALITVEMPVKIRDTVVVTLAVRRHDDRDEPLLGKLFRNVIDRRQGKGRISILKVAVNAITGGMCPVIYKILKYQKPGDCYSYSGFSQSVRST